MKMIHLSDLHLGKRLNEFNLIEDQKTILEQILRIIEEERPDTVIIAGDVYDKSVPSAEAVTLFDWFLCQLADQKLQVFVISGNHDSPERIAFASRLVESSGIHLSPVYDGTVRPVTLEDCYGPVDFFMLPFIKPVHVRRCYPEAVISTYTDALRTAIENMPLNTDRRNVLITHQFVTGAERSDSEELSIGGSDNVDASVFDAFDYVALGHIHSPQNIGSERIRYCGTPLKYSFSEAGQQKSVTVATLKERDCLELKTIPLHPVRDLREIRGPYLELTARECYQNTRREDYLHITLTDEEETPDVIGKLRLFYPNLMKLDYDNARTRHIFLPDGAEDVEAKSPLTLFKELFEQQNGYSLSIDQQTFCEQLIREIWEDRL